LGLRGKIEERSGENYVTWSFTISTLKYYSADQVKKNEMGGVCSTYGKQESCIEGFGGEM
jgi:hypothetical protein